MSMQKTTNKLKEFLAYLNSIYGYLASATLFFPLANQFFKVIPLPSENTNTWVYFATLSGAFMFFYQFTRRDTQEAQIGNGMIAFVFSIISVGIYVAFPYGILYATIFFVLTYSFSELAVVEFQKIYPIDPKYISKNPSNILNFVFKIIGALFTFFFWATVVVIGLGLIVLVIAAST
ncbi:MAG TPA: hypothetical protein DHW49_01550 [Anaerolineae bacterium]|nr:hypothetical protein [Anaerolineae bacterium]